MTRAYVTASGTWTVPANVYLLNWVDGIGAGANGTIYGGGGGAYARKLSLSVTPGDNFDVVAGSGLDAIFGGTSLGLCVMGAAKASGRTGGLASASVGDIKYNGGSNINAYRGAGGAAGPNGAGNNNSNHVGGSGDAGFGGAGGAIDSDGSPGTEYDGSHGSGGGGGGYVASAAGNGGNYGAGGGGAISSPGTGAPSLIVIDYTVTAVYSITADVGTFTLTGVAATATITQKIIGETGTFTLVGNNVNFLSNTFDCLGGTFTLTGIAAIFNSGATITAAVGAFAVVGETATLLPLNPSTINFYAAAQPRTFVVAEGS